jgi:hypothetical protein
MDEQVAQFASEPSKVSRESAWHLGIDRLNGRRFIDVLVIEAF